MSFHLFVGALENIYTQRYINFGAETHRGEFDTIEAAFEAAKHFNPIFSVIQVAELVDGQFINRMTFFEDTEYTDEGQLEEKGFRSNGSVISLAASFTPYAMPFGDYEKIIRQELEQRGCAGIQIHRYEKQKIIEVKFVYRGMAYRKLRRMRLATQIPRENEEIELRDRIVILFQEIHEIGVNQSLVLRPFSGTEGWNLSGEF